MENEKVNEIAEKIFNEVVKPFLSKNPHTFEIKPKLQQRHEERLSNIEAQGKHITELIQNYLDAVEEAKRNKKLSPKEKLKKLLSPLISLQEIYLPNYLKHHKFIDDSYIDFRKELDLENIERNSESYSILGDGELELFGLLHTGSCNIYISKQYWGELLKKNGTVSDYPGSNNRSVQEIYKYWLPTLTIKEIKSSDLLAQILVCYTMKRALNGERDAINKLTEVLLESVDLTEIHSRCLKLLSSRLHRELRKRHSKEEIYNKIPTTIDLDEEEIQENIVDLLPMLISGWQPLIIIEKLQQKMDGKMLLPFSIWMTEFFLRYLTTFPISHIFFNPYAPITSEMECADPFMGTLKGFSYPPNTHKAALKFNNYCFIPGRGYKLGPKSNLYTWLFYKYGKIYQLIRDNKWPFIRREHPFLSIHSRKFRPPKEKTRTLADADISSFVDVLVENGIERDFATIFCRAASGEKKAKIARAFNISRPTVYARCEKVKTSPALKKPTVLESLRKILS